MILVRERASDGAVEVYLQRRHRKASFMSSAFVFPGGAVDPGEADLRRTAARELFEEAGVWLSGAPLDAEARSVLTRWREHLHAGACTLDEIEAGLGAPLDLDAMCFFAHWITPSIEPKRFSAEFFLARMPSGQRASVDNREMVDDTWVTPADALSRAGELGLPPPQLRTFFELDRILTGEDAAGKDESRAIERLFAGARERVAHRHPILPRLAAGREQVTLLLPWDPDYADAGTGEAMPMPADHPLAVGPSRFVLQDRTWTHIDAASSPSAG